jgi:dCMP deaminase
MFGRYRKPEPCKSYRGNLCSGFGGETICDFCGWDRFEHKGRGISLEDIQSAWYDIPTPKQKKWMEISFFSASKLSTCGKRQYCAYILAPDGSVAGVGYNGGPSGLTHCVDGGCPRLAAGSAPGSNYDDCIAIHAEENALMRSTPERRAGGTLIVNGPPCFGCAKKMCNSGLSQVVIVDDPSYAQASAGWEFMRKAGLEVIILDPDLFKEKVTGIADRIVR